MSARAVLVVTFSDVKWASYVKGHGSRELLTELRGRAPVWSTRERAWCVTERTARDVIAVAESRGMQVDVRGWSA